MKSHLTLSGHQDSVYWVTFSPDGSRLASASRDGTAIVWDAVAGRVQYRLPPHGGSVTSVAFSPNGRLLATGSTDGTATIWGAGSGEHYHTISGANPECLVFSPDSSELLVGGSDAQVRCWNVDSARLVRALEVSPGRVLSLHFSPDGQTLAAASSEGRVVFFDTETWSPRKSIQLGPAGLATVYRCIFSPDRETCAASLHIRLGGSIGRTFTPDRYEILVWNLVMEGEPDVDQALLGHIGWIGGLDFAPKGDLLASGAYDETVRLWDPYFHSFVAEAHEHEGAVYAVAFSPNGELLASCSADATVKLWQVADAISDSGTPSLKPAIPTIEDIIATVVVTARHGRDTLLVAAQDLLDGLLALESPKAVEDALAGFLAGSHPLWSHVDKVAGSLAGPGGFWRHLLTAVLYAVDLRRAQAAQEGDQATAERYYQLGLRMSKVSQDQVDVEYYRLKRLLGREESDADS